MSVYNFLSPGFPAGLMPKPTRSLFQDDMFTNSWQSNLGMDGLGDANFEVPATGASTSGGLRIFFAGALAGAAGEGFTASVVAGGTTGIAIDVDAKTIVVTRAAGATLNAINTLVTAEARLQATYFDDGDPGNDVGLVAAHTVRDGHAPRGCAIRLQKNDEALIYIGPTAPDSDIALDNDYGIDGAVFLRAGDSHEFFAVPPGERLWHRRHGNADFAGSMEMWK